MPPGNARFSRPGAVQDRESFFSSIHDTIARLRKSPIPSRGPLPIGSRPSCSPRASRGEWAKLLLDLGGSPLIRRVVATVASCPWQEIVVVLGFEAEQVGAVLDGLPVRLAVDDEYREGQPTFCAAAWRRCA
jgi:MobA-like NTP transferase domain